MKYSYKNIRDNAHTGDVLLIKSDGFVGRFIRIFTGESFSHVAMLLWIEGSLFVSEFVEGKGYQLLPASLWVADRLEDDQQVYFGRAPDAVREHAGHIQDCALQFRKQSYGWSTLIKVWFSQVTGIDLKVKRFVCSTYVAQMWREGDYLDFTKTADPGDFQEHCDFLTRIWPARESQNT